VDEEVPGAKGVGKKVNLLKVEERGGELQLHVPDTAEKKGKCNLF